jgi:hypothetical protein
VPALKAGSPVTRSITSLTRWRRFLHGVNTIHPSSILASRGSPARNLTPPCGCFAIENRPEKSQCAQAQHEGRSEGRYFWGGTRNGFAKEERPGRYMNRYSNLESHLFMGGFVECELKHPSRNHDLLHREDERIRRLLNVDGESSSIGYISRPWSEPGFTDETRREPTGKRLFPSSV